MEIADEAFEQRLTLRGVELAPGDALSRHRRVVVTGSGEKTLPAAQPGPALLLCVERGEKIPRLAGIDLQRRQPLVACGKIRTGRAGCRLGAPEDRAHHPLITQNEHS